LSGEGRHLHGRRVLRCSASPAAPGPLWFALYAAPVAQAAARRFKGSTSQPALRVKNQSSGRFIRKGGRCFSRRMIDAKGYLRTASPGGISSHPIQRDSRFFNPGRFPGAAFWDPPQAPREQFGSARIPPAPSEGACSLRHTKQSTTIFPLTPPPPS
jgi:hypothetical protein